MDLRVLDRSFCDIDQVFNPAYPEGMMLAILLMNVWSPLIDYFVVQSHIKHRQKRFLVKKNA
jgi:Na+-transporting NADH:ubiquinone oxidoreductase subunit B